MSVPFEMAMTLQDTAGQLLVVLEEPREAPDAVRWVGLYPSRVAGCNALARLGLLSPKAADTVLAADLAVPLAIPTNVPNPKQTLRSFHSSFLTGWQ